MRKVLILTGLTAMLAVFAGVALADDNGQGTAFFGIQSNPAVDSQMLNGQDEQDAGQGNQGWDGGTGEVVPGDANPQVPDVPDPVPADE